MIHRIVMNPNEDTMTAPNFLTPDQARALQAEFGTPLYVYDEQSLRAQAQALLAFPHPYGYTARYAMKACPNSTILRILHEEGLHIDASSAYEAQRAMAAGIPANHIQLTAQQLPHNLEELISSGVLFNACSLHQLSEYGRQFPGSEVCVRINPGLGSGHNNRTNTGGPSSSFGIWHEHLGDIQYIATEHDLRITRMHTHIGSGSDPAMWDRCARLALAVVAKLPDVQTLSLGGGFKVLRMADEQSTDLQQVGQKICAELEAFATDHDRQLHLELEPGTFLVANAGAIIATVMDVIDTGAEGYNFIKIDSGMTELLRPSMYGAQHPIALVPAKDGERPTADYLIAGHCCESGDLLTPEPGNPEGLAPRTLPQAHIGDALVIDGAGAYGASMSSKNYNSFPEAPEILMQTKGTPKLIRQRQTLDQLLANEIA
jgi:diaminopimelate decarboxylase